MLAIGCASRSVPRAVSPSSTLESSGLHPADYPTQRLLRIRYQGRDGELGFRTILRLTDPEHFQMRAVDLLGRALWGIEYSHPEVHFINYREKLECRTVEPIVISEMALELLPVAELPAVLVGRLPSPLLPAGPGTKGRFLDAHGRQWSVSRVGSSIDSWTLWKDREPLLWFRSLDEGGILSHREGSQFRWRQTLIEPLDKVPPPLERPPGIRAVGCEELGSAI
jgi:hypothetical protein